MQGLVLELVLVLALQLGWEPASGSAQQQQQQCGGNEAKPAVD